MLSLRLAWRNIWRNPRRTGIVVTAVAVGISGCIVSMAINYGMIAQMVETAVATQLGHIQLHAAGFEADPELRVRMVDGGSAAVRAIDAEPGVKAWARRVVGEGLVNSTRSSAGVSVLGVEPDREADVSLIADSIVAGSWFDPTERRVVMGARLADRLQVGVGDKIVLSAQNLDGDLTGQGFRVGGLFRMASAELDQNALLLRIEDGQALFGLGDAVSEIVVLTQRPEAIEGLQASLRSRLGDAVEVKTWEEIEPLLVYMVEVFDVMAWYLYGAIFTAMAFGIANVLLMAVFERRREIGMLMAVGMQRRRIVTMVVMESIFVTLIGLAIGLALSLGAVHALRGGIDLSAFAEGVTAFGIGTRLVPVLRPDDFQIPLVIAVIAAALASLWPALRAVGSRPAEALRQL